MLKPYKNIGNEKQCSDCGEIKPLTDFFISLSKRKNPWYSKRCKPCHNKWCREYRQTPKHKKAYKKWVTSERGKAVRKLGWQNWHKKNKHKAFAQYTTSNAIRDKRLIRQSCVICNASNAEAHHPDYSKPFHIVWLCKKHHFETHYPN